MRFLDGIDVPATRTRMQPDEYNKFTEVTFDFVVKNADIQPTGNKLMALPEGLRNSVEYTVYSKTPMTAGKEGSNEKPDKLLIYGEWFVVIKCDPWLNGLDDYYLAYVSRETKR